MEGGVYRKFESFVGNLGSFAPPTGKSEFPPLGILFRRIVYVYELFST
jgi:hypothetical protein